jgi:16S rRNA (cytidine1402-2'-O)-methyltransferase
MTETLHDSRAGIGELYVVATPIGNLEDFSFRALRVLRTADVITAEDTRIASRLLAHYGIAQRPVALHAHNERKRTVEVLRWLADGKRVALLSDAGTPAISDPGAIVVAEAREAGYRVVPIPGPNALAAALSVAGLTEEKVLFCGFLPATRAARQKAIAQLFSAPYTLVFYEAPHRVLECVEDLAAGLARPESRRIVVARELTKLFETVYGCPLCEAVDWFNADPNRLRGEFVLIVTGASETDSIEQWEQVLAALVKELPLAQAVRLTCAATGAKRNTVYARALALRETKQL